ncbi:MAG: hypothetical protein QNI87_15360 [Erythrobacter sp.]|uniref:hypothetical protein n=1 Tax=Erythrobacter sp. TaxID=1042 RepID=UPI002635D267|nr:hypothetical protein [Erythrobacter sp.]MDJ0979903.1 hypothetical protein [Erythrobacter sp.]
MMMTTSRLRQIGWSVVLGVCIAAFAVLSLTVHAVRNEVLLADIDIVRLEIRKQRLETEFQARASQHQLARWNRVDLGFGAPRADQYLEGRQQLAALGQPRGPGAPSPIRVARADPGSAPSASARDMVSPVSGRPVTLASAQAPDDAGTLFTEAFGDFLIEASPIRPAKAQTSATASLTGEVAE